MVEWRELLFEECDFAYISYVIWPLNPPDPDRLEHVQKLLEDAYYQINQDEAKGHIVVKEQGKPGELLPLVYVMDEKGVKRNFYQYRLQEILAMPIRLELKEEIDQEKLLLILLFYLAYPLRIQRQKKRDGAGLFSLVLRQRIQSFPQE